MEEQKRIERDLMSQEEFGDYISNNIMMLHLTSYNVVNNFKSVRRAMKRGHITTEGYIIPRRPFNNRANTCSREGKYSRSMNELKRGIYARLKQY